MSLNIDIDTPTPVQWFCARALLAHLTALALVPVFLLAAWWQVRRAVSGNTLSYLYAVEWPAFAGVALWAWWQIVHLPPVEEQGSRPPTPPAWLKWDRDEESPELASYNQYLLEINLTGKRRPWALQASTGRVSAVDRPGRQSEIPCGDPSETARSLQNRRSSARPGDDDG